MLLIFNDPRIQLVGTDSNMGFQVDYQFVGAKFARRLASTSATGNSFKVTQAEGWQRVKSTPMQGTMLLVNVAGVSLAFIIYMSVFLRRFVSIKCCHCPSLEMRNEIPYSEILKKFTGDEDDETLKGPFDAPADDIEKQNLLKPDVEEQQIAEESGEQVTISDVVSHDTVDSKGAAKVVKVAREEATKQDIEKHVFKKKQMRGEVMNFVPTEANVAAKNDSGIVVDRSESEDYGLLSQNTKGAVPAKSKVEELFSSEGVRTLGDQKQPGAIEAKNKKHMDDEERGGPAETPPDFSESEIHEDGL